MRISLERKSVERVPSGEKRKKDDREVSEAGIVKKNAIMKADFALHSLSRPAEPLVSTRKKKRSADNIAWQSCKQSELR
jgi:hypothetical protein